MTFTNVDEVLELAVANEEKAARLYRDLAERAKRPGMRETFLEFAREEAQHKARLLWLREGGLPASDAKIENLQLDRYLVAADPSPGMTYPEALVYAIKAEDDAFQLYTSLAGSVGDQSVADLFRSLAQEELKHKHRFEAEYEDRVLEGV